MVMTLDEDVTVALRVRALWKVGEVAELFETQPKTVYAWVKRERISAIRTPTGRIRIPGSEVARLLQEVADAQVDEGDEVIE